MLKVVFISNIPSPYQVKFIGKLRQHFDIQFWYTTDIEDSNRPKYWKMQLPKYCFKLSSISNKPLFFYSTVLNSQLNKFNPDIVWVGGAWHMSAFVQAYRWAVKNNKIVLAGPMETTKNNGRFLSKTIKFFFYKFFFKHMDGYLCNGYNIYDYLRHIVPSEKLYIFMNTEDYAPYVSHPARDSNNKITFFYGGAFNRRLRVPELLKAFEKVASRFKNVRLVLSGFGSEKGICEQIISDSDILRERVEWFEVSKWAQIPEAYKRGDVFVINADFSGGSYSTLYAIASGMGIISSINVTAARHFVIDGYNGFIINNERSLCSAMEKYARNPKLVKIHGIRNKQISMVLLYPNRIAQLKEIFLDILSKHESVNSKCKRKK